MIPLYNYINSPTIDGHIHLFNGKGTIDEKTFDCPSYIEKQVGFIDIEPKYLQRFKDVTEYYESYIKHSLNDNTILLVSATNPNDIKELYNKYRKDIKGIGELKCYDMYKDKKLDLKKHKWIRECLSFANQEKLPVYIHYTLIGDKYKKSFENLLKSYPDTNIVLCHCGMDDTCSKEEQDNIYRYVVALMKQYSNLWVDVTYTAAKYFKYIPTQLYNLDTSRVILGTDINPALITKYPKTYQNKLDEIYDTFNLLGKYVDSDRNIKKLFNI